MQRLHVPSKPPVVLVAELVPLKKAQVWLPRLPKRKQVYAVVKKRVKLVKNAQKQRTRPRKKKRLLPKKLRPVQPVTVKPRLPKLQPLA